MGTLIVMLATLAVASVDALRDREAYRRADGSPAPECTEWRTASGRVGPTGPEQALHANTTEFWAHTEPDALWIVNHSRTYSLYYAHSAAPGSRMLLPPRRSAWESLPLSRQAGDLPASIWMTVTTCAE